MKIIYTNHAKERILQRKISLRDIEGALRAPFVEIIQADGTTLFQKETKKGILEIVVKKSHTTYIIITAYYL